MAEKKYTFHVHGMHCTSCEHLTEAEIKEDPRVRSVKSNLATRTTEVVGDFGELGEGVIAEELSKKLSQHRLEIEKEQKSISWKDFYYALPIALGFIALFILLQKLGIVNLVKVGEVSYGAAFFIGIVASLSTCMAVVGGLVLSISANFAKEGDKFRPQALFHIGRIVSFFILGGVIGAIGSNFALGQTGTFVLGLIVGIVMLILGINLLDVFHFTKQLMPTMPKIFATHTLGITKLNHTLTPVLIGIATFFLPCGFTQSMQFYTLTTGSFLKGGLTMFFFALGTLPVLALLSFSSFSIQNSSRAGIFFKTAGLVVILFALFNLINSFAAYGIIPPIFNF